MNFVRVEKKIKFYILSESSECRESTGIDFIEAKTGLKPDFDWFAKIWAEMIEGSVGTDDPALDGKITEWTGCFSAFFPSWLKKSFKFYMAKF